MNPQSTETVRPAAGASEAESRSAHPGTPPRRQSKLLLYFIPAVCLAIFAGLVFWRVQTRQHVAAELVPAAADANEIPVAVIHPVRSDLDQAVTLPGNVQAYVETPIYARTDGYLKKWYVDIGGKVSAGQLLATIETPEVDEQLRQAEAAVGQVQANLDLARTTAERWQNLLKSDGVSQQEVDQNEAAYKAQQANLVAANANVDRLKYLQSFQRVTAPFSGVITERDIDIGALISSGNAKQLFRIAQIDVLRVFVNVPEGDSNEMKAGLPAELHVAEFPNRSFTGKVTRTAGAIDTSSRTLLTEVQVANPKGELLPGAYAEVLFHFKGGNPALVVPSNTLIFRSGPQIAVVQGKTARLRSVTIGRDFGNSLEINSGLQATDSVILNPPDSLTDGASVSVQEVQQTQPATAGGQ